MPKTKKKAAPKPKAATKRKPKLTANGKPRTEHTPGRKPLPKGQRKDLTIAVKCTPEEWDKIAAKAEKLAGGNMSALLRAAGMKHKDKVEEPRKAA